MRRTIMRTVAGAVGLVAVIVGSIVAVAAGDAAFTDGFEGGDLSRWTSATNMTVTKDAALTGSFAGRAATTSAPAFAYKTLPAAIPEIYVRASLRVESRETAVTLLRVRRGDGTKVVQVFLTATGALAYRVDTNGTTRTSLMTIADGAWHTLDLHVRAGSPGLVEMTLDGQTFSHAETIGGLFRRVQIGDDTSGKRYSVLFDDVAADASPIVTVDAPPTTPTNLGSTSDPTETVELAWDPSFDESGVSAYIIYRDNVVAATVEGTSTSFVDTPPSTSTVYAYRVVAISAGGQRSEPTPPLLVTMPEFARPDDAIVFAAGDIACASVAPTATSCWQRATSDVFVQHEPDAVLTLGDNQYEKGTLESFRKSFDPTWGRAKPLILPVTGNHEYNTPGAAGYFAYFGDAAGDPSGGYYRTSVAGWDIFALNGNCAIVSCAEGSAQHTWLEEQLSQSDATCALAAFHQPVWSSRNGRNTSVLPLVALLYDHGVELVLVAHDHFYERFAPQSPAGQADPSGIRQITVGTGGRSLYPFKTVMPNSVARDNTTFGVLKLTLHQGTYDWSFVPAWGHGSFTDEGSDTCH